MGPDGPRYEVEHIVMHRDRAGQKEMFLHWKGYDASHGRWVSRASLAQDVPGLVAAYELSPSTLLIPVLSQKDDDDHNTHKNPMFIPSEKLIGSSGSHINYQKQDAFAGVPNRRGYHTVDPVAYAAGAHLGSEEGAPAQLHRIVT